MVTERLEPERLTPSELDDRLARGWYRMGYGLITTDLLSWGGELRSTVWTRLDVRGHRFKPSLRKLVARNGRLFQVRVGALAVDDAHEQLYARYLEKVGGERAESLSDVLGGARGIALFDTREISVWKDDRLVAFSWYDLGRLSVQSLIGVYDPAFARYSLGLYTMLLEILQTAELGRHYHYAGYVLAEPSSMDYKLQVASLEFFDPVTSRWLLAPPFASGESPAEILRGRLDAAEGELRRAGVLAARYLNPALQIGGLLERAPACPTQPLFLVCGAQDSLRVLVAWEHDRGVYALMRARPVLATLTREGTPPVDILLFFVEAQLGERSSAGEVAALARDELSSLPRA
jgi:leucyl-tRNA---protein transferase